MPYTAQFFAEKLNIGVEYFNPFRNVTIEPHIDLEELAKVAHSFGEVVGLGLRNLAQCPVELNLIPKSIRSKQAFDAKKPYFIATVVSLILVVFALGYFYMRTADIKHESLAELNSKLEPLQKRAEQMDNEVKLIKRAQQELDVYTGYLKDRFFWPEALVEMRNLLVKAEEKLAKPGQDVRRLDRELRHRRAGRGRAGRIAGKCIRRHGRRRHGHGRHDEHDVLHVESRADETLFPANVHDDDERPWRQRR